MLFNFPRLCRRKVATASCCVEWSSPALVLSSSLVSCCSTECTEITLQVYYQPASSFTAANHSFIIYFIPLCPLTQNHSASQQEQQKSLPWSKSKLQSRTDRPKRNRKRRTQPAEGSIRCLLLFTGFCSRRCTTVCQQRIHTFNEFLPNEHCTDILLLCLKWHILL